MKLGPDLIVVCPGCGARACVPSLLSRTTLSVRQWTDGKLLPPALPRTAPITPCRRCGRVYWWGDTIVGQSTRALMLLLGTGVLYGAPLMIYLGAPSISVAGWGLALLATLLGLIVRRQRRLMRPALEAHYLDALDAGMGTDRDRELTLRLHAWWAGNDPARERVEGARSGAESSAVAPRSERAEASLRRLLELLDAEAPDERLLKAEAARELGDFERAEELLRGDFPEAHAAVAGRIRELTARRETKVAEVMRGV